MPLTLKNFYRQWWQPDPSRTIFYYDFEQNLNDSSGNWNNITSSNWIWYDNIGWQYVVQNNVTSNWYLIHPWFNSLSDFTVSFWVYVVNPWSGRMPMLFGQQENVTPYKWITVWFWPDMYNSQWNTNSFSFMMDGSTYHYTWWKTLDSWYHVVFTRISWTCKVYINNNKELEYTDNTSFVNWPYRFLFNSNNDSSKQWWWNTWAKMDKFILENVWWSAQEIADYFNATKSLYGIS